MASEVPLLRHGVLRFVLVSRATFSRGPLNPNWRSLRRFLDARAERGAGPARDTVLLVKAIGIVFTRRTWRVVLAQGNATTDGGGGAEIASGRLRGVGAKGERLSEASTVSHTGEPEKST
jgi:hypothetical protein